MARKWFGSRSATKNASATGPAPSTAASMMSRMKPVMRDSSVNPPTMEICRIMPSTELRPSRSEVPAGILFCEPRCSLRLALRLAGPVERRVALQLALIDQHREAGVYDLLLLDVDRIEPRQRKRKRPHLETDLPGRAF